MKYGRTKAGGTPMGSRCIVVEAVGFEPTIGIYEDNHIVLLIHTWARHQAHLPTCEYPHAMFQFFKERRLDIVTVDTRPPRKLRQYFFKIFSGRWVVRYRYISTGWPLKIAFKGVGVALTRQKVPIVKTRHNKSHVLHNS